MKKTLLFILKTIAALVLFLGLQQLIELKTRGFWLKKIVASDILYQPSWETDTLSSEEMSRVDNLLNQPYRLIGSGSECFAFMSEDRQTVIKFFKFDHVRYTYLNRGLFREDHSIFAGKFSDHPLTRWELPNPFQQSLKRLLGIREFRIQRTMNSIKLAYDELQEETGLLYLHLNPTDYFHRTLSLYDGNGIRHEINLDQTRFFLQKGAVPLERHFSLLRKQGKHEDARKSIDSFLKLIQSRCKKGFADRDPLNKNFGFISNKAIEIDTGSFQKDPEMNKTWNYKRELFYVTLGLKSWMKKNYPEMVDYLEKKVSEEICLHQ